MKRPASSLLAVDIGNSNVGLGFYPDAEKETPLLVNNVPWRKLSAENLSLQIKKFLQVRSLNCSDIGVIISSVVPSLNSKVMTAMKSFCKEPLIVSHHFAGGLSFEVPHPETIGSDRIANAVAGFNLFGKPAAIVDLGTATTITIVGGNNNLQGGAILPGIDMMSESLASGTSKLPAVSLSAPRSALGRDTVSAIRSGIIYGTAGAVENIVTRLENDLGRKLRVILTGGRADLLSPHLKIRHVMVPHLVFEGMRLIFVRICGTGRS